MNKMTKEKAGASFAAGIDCSQVVFGHVAESIGLNAGDAKKIASAFGGGMWAGQTCGCVTGALMAIGYKFGHSEDGDVKTKENMLEKKYAFEKAFKEKYSSLLCKEILGYDLSIPEDMEKIMEEGLLSTLCPQVACDTCEILEQILEEK